MAWSEEQIRNAQVIYQVGRELGASVRDIQVALAAAIVESGLRSLDYGDRDSIGLFQQRDAWGSREARLDPHQSARMFFLGGGAGQEGLLDIANRDSTPIGVLAQDVQVSAFPERYGEQAEAASGLLRQLDPSAEIPATPGTLGTVQGLPDQPSTLPPELAPQEPTVLEVNALGEVTADESGIGSLSFGEAFVDGLTFENASSQAAQAQSRGDAANIRHITIPTLEQYGISMGAYTPAAATPAGGETFSGSFAGKSPYELTQLDGKTVDYMTAAALKAASEEFGGEFAIMQGSHNPGGVAASGGTHDGGGVVDLNVPNGDWEGAVAALRKIGFAAWARNIPGSGQAGSGAHVHAVLMGHEQLSPEAQTQVQSYLNNDDGLVGSRSDDGPRDYVNNRFTWGEALDIENDPMRRSIAQQADSLLGTPFKWGGDDYGGVDDAGLVRKVYRSVGVDVPRLAFTLGYSIEPEPIEHAKLGDLISWGGDRLGIYAGDGTVIHAAVGGAVQLSYLTDFEDAFSMSVPKVARNMAYSGNPGPYEPPTQAAPPPLNYDAPASQAPTPAPSGGGGGGGGQQSNNGGGDNNNDGNWHPTPDGDGYIG